MSPPPFRHQPAFRAVVLVVLLVATWIYDYVRSGDQGGSATAAGLDVILLVLTGLASLFFLSQFCLPVKSLPNRLRIAGGLWLHAWGAHGPAIFVQNGRKVERRGEAGRARPGVIWIDTASAVLTCTEAGPRRVLGPGIHFSEPGERVDKVFSLHNQVCALGPGQDGPIFEAPAEGASEEERDRFDRAQALRRAVSGLTRDGNEVVPEIRISFRLDDQPSEAGQPGSRFGFSAEAVERAVRSEGFIVDPVAARRVQVAWNQLPGLIAVDLWREYLAKFTLEDLFAARFGPVPEVLQPEAPVQASEPALGLQQAPRGRAAHWLWHLNNRLEHRAAAAESNPSGGMDGAPASRSRAPHQPMLPGREYTALQVIAHMIRERMSRAAVPNLDECGRYTGGHALSEEYQRLRERGLKVLDVTLGGYRFAPAVEEQIVRQWKTTWLEAADIERAHVERLEVLAAEAGRQRALLDHAKTLGAAVRAEPSGTVADTLRALIVAAHGTILSEERLRGKGGNEALALAELAKWVEAPNNG